MFARLISLGRFDLSIVSDRYEDPGERHPRISLEITEGEWSSMGAYITSIDLHFHIANVYSLDLGVGYRKLKAKRPNMLK